MTYYQQAYKGLILLLAKKWFMIIINVLSIYLLVRYLPTEAFGQMALASAFITIPVIIISRVIDKYIIPNQEHDLSDKTRALFYMLMLFSVLVWLALFLLKGLILSFFSMQFYWLLIILLAKASFDYLLMIPDAIFRKELNFKSITYRDLLIDVLIKVLSVVMAMNHYGVYSLVFPMLLMAPIRLFITLFITSWRPGLHAYLYYWREILRYVRIVLISGIIEAFNEKIDIILIGNLMGEHVLGLYYIVNQLAFYVHKNILSVLNSVFFSVFSKNNKAPDLLKEPYLRMQRLLVYLLIPVFLFLIIYANEIILLVYGKQYLSIVTSFRVLIILAMRKSITSYAVRLFDILRKPQIDLYIRFLLMVLLTVGIYVSSDYGIEGVVVAICTVKITVSIIRSRLVIRLLGIRLIELWRNVNFELGLGIAYSIVGISFYFILPPLDVIAVIGIGFFVIIMFFMITFLLKTRASLELKRIVNNVWVRSN